MAINLAEIATLDKRATDSRSFFMPEQQGYSNIYEASDSLAQYGETLGYPSFRLGGQGVDVCSIAFGRDALLRYAHAWQITMRNKESNILLHGRIVNDKDEWQSLSLDNQGGVYHEAFIDDGEGILAEFVLGAINKANTGAIAESMRVRKLKKEAQYAARSTGDNAPSSMLLRPNKAVVELLRQYREVGFVSAGLRGIKNVGLLRQYSTTITSHDLPEWAQNAITSPVGQVEVPYADGRA